MISSVQMKKIVSFAKKRALQNDAFHNFSHFEEVSKNASVLAKKEGADVDVCIVAGLLHDICKSEKGDHGSAGAKDAKKFLLNLNFPKNFVSAVYDAIYFHNKEFHDGPIERRVLWDADKLTIAGPEGFFHRLLPYWIARKGKKQGIETAIYEYRFFEPLFRTESGRKAVMQYSDIMQNIFESLTKEVMRDA